MTAFSMDNKTALHTAARRFCEDRFDEWAESYSQLGARERVSTEDKFEISWDYSEEAYGIFPRYRLDKATRVEVERLMPESCKSLQHVRQQLIAAGNIAETRLLAEFKNKTALKAIRAEAYDYKAYVMALHEEDLSSIEPLPFRRALSFAESENLRSRLKKVWNIGDGYWFPLREGPIPPNVIAFHTEYFKKMDGAKLLRERLAERGVVRAFEVQEFGPDEPDNEIEISILNPSYFWGGEQYCTDERLDWVVYASHESSITVAGDWLSDFFRKEWPDWEQRTYGGPFSTPDLRGTWGDLRSR
jgi:hypothetical protein